MKAMNTLLDTLNTLAHDVNNNIRLLNYGGCAVFAAHVGYHLKYTLSLQDVVLRVGDHESNNGKVKISEYRKDVSSNGTATDWNFAGVYFGHVIVEFKLKGKKYHYDTLNGVTKPSKTAMNRYPLYRDGLSVEEGLSISSVADGWNDTFNRKQIPKLITIINKHMLAEMRSCD